MLRAAVAGLADAELDRRPSDGGWTPREVVHHVADSEMTSAIRLRRLIAEDEPLIVGYDGDEFARRLHYADRPIAPALAAVEAARATTAQILHGLTEAEWARMGTHSDSGTYGVQRMARDLCRPLRRSRRPDPRSAEAARRGSPVVDTRRGAHPYDPVPEHAPTPRRAGTPSGPDPTPDGHAEPARPRDTPKYRRRSVASSPSCWRRASGRG